MYYSSQTAHHKNYLGKVSASEFWEREEFRMMVRKNKRTLQLECGGISTLNHGRYVRKTPFSLYSSHNKNVAMKSLWKYNKSP